MNGKEAETAFSHCIQIVDMLENNFDAYCSWQNCDLCPIGKRRCRGFINAIKKVRNNFYEIKWKIESNANTNGDTENG